MANNSWNQVQVHLSSQDFYDFVETWWFDHDMEDQRDLIVKLMRKDKRKWEMLKKMFKKQQQKESECED
jgi:hypothetical protein